MTYTITINHKDSTKESMYNTDLNSLIKAFKSNLAFGMWEGKDVTFSANFDLLSALPVKYTKLIAIK